MAEGTLYSLPYAILRMAARMILPPRVLGSRAEIIRFCYGIIVRFFVRTVMLHLKFSNFFIS